jgi:glyoxylase-like metal-dependent hydrolase (beta-lactamase superfamily II)
MGNNLLFAIGNTTRLPVTHLVYSHLHTDHIGGASLFNASHPTIIAHEETLGLLASVTPRDPHRPLPHITFKDKYTLRVGNQTLELSYHGPNHTPSNIFMYAPAQRVALLIDVIFPGWVPFAELAISDFIPGWTAAHDVLLTFDFDVFVPGHVGRLGTKHDVLQQKKCKPNEFPPIMNIYSCSTPCRHRGPAPVLRGGAQWRVQHDDSSWPNCSCEPGERMGPIQSVLPRRCTDVCG